MSNDRKIQARVAQTILEDSHRVVLGGKEYRVAPPTLGTLIRASEMIARLPEAIKVNEGREFQDILAAAKDYRALADFAAVLILGAKKAAEEVEVREKVGFLRRSKKVSQTRAEVLSREILDSTSPSELKEAVIPLLEGLQLNDFFITTTFLSGINVTKPTRKVETKPTASGESSEAS